MHSTLTLSHEGCNINAQRAVSDLQFLRHLLHAKNPLTTIVHCSSLYTEQLPLFVT